MPSKTLFESVMWGRAVDVNKILRKRGLPIDEHYTDYALLIMALRRGRKEIAKILLNKGCRVKKVQHDDLVDSPLHLAVKMEDLEIIKTLLGKGAVADTVDFHGDTPLHFAIKKGFTGIVDLVLSAVGGDCANVMNKDRFSHLHIACMRNNVDVVENFLKNGADINHSVNFQSILHPGFTALHFAVELNCVDTVKLLLKYNADFSVKNALDKTPLFLAMEYRNDEIANIILSSISVKDSNPMNDHGLSHFHIACMKHHLGAVENFLNHGVDINQTVKLTSNLWSGYTPLHFAVKGFTVHCEKQVELVELLLRHKADVHAKDAEGQTPLHLACLQSDLRISKFIQDIVNLLKKENGTASYPEFIEKFSEFMSQTDQIKIINLLLKYKSDVNAKTNLKETPIFFLYKFNRSKIPKNSRNVEYKLIKHVFKVLNNIRCEITKILVNHNADLNLQNEMNHSLLHTIAAIQKSFDDDHKEEIAELLLSKGVDVDVKDEYEKTPLYFASSNGHVQLIELFLCHNADVNACETSNQTTPLHVATSCQQAEVIEILLANGADVTALQCNNMNVLHIMALENPDVSEELKFIELYDSIIKSFIEQGCDINAQDLYGRTPLHIAAWNYNVAAIWALIEHFADINVKNFADETPLSFPTNYTRRCTNIQNIFADFLNVLRFAKLPVDGENNIYFELYRVKKFHNKDDLEMQCKQELAMMKKVKLNNRTTLHDIMYKNANEMVVFAGNEILEEVLNSNDFENKYNIYKNLLKSQHRKGLAKKKLLKNAKESLESMINLGLPDSCSDGIFRYLSDKNLNNLVKAKTVSLTDENVEVQQATYDSNDAESVNKALAYCRQLFERQKDIDIK